MKLCTCTPYHTRTGQKLSSLVTVTARLTRPPISVSMLVHRMIHRMMCAIVLATSVFVIRLGDASTSHPIKWITKSKSFSVPKILEPSQTLYNNKVMKATLY